MEPEEWRWIAGYEGRYQVSNLGRVQSFLFSREGRLMSPDKAHKGGYVRFHLQFKKTVSLHRIVATAFIPNPDDLPAVNHIDGNPRNNRVSNLEWISHSDNMRHSWRKLESFKNRVAVSPRGEASPKAKLTDAKVRAMREEYERGGTSHQKLAKKYGVSKPGARLAINRTNWKHVA